MPHQGESDGSKDDKLFVFDRLTILLALSNEAVP